MPTKFLVPRLGEGVDEVTIVKWLKSEGEAVNELEPLVEVETDKVVTEVPSPASGVVLKIEIPEGSPARVGQVMAWIGQPGESLAAQAEAGKQAASLPAQVEADAQKPMEAALPAAGTPSGGLPTGGAAGFLSPVVRKMAAEHGIDLSQVRGTGLGGRITKQDVLQFLESRAQKAEGVQPAPTAVQAAPAVTPAPGDQFIRHSTIRKQIAERMVASKRISPHVLTVMEADLSRVIAHRAANKALFARDGVHLTFTAYFVAALAAALKAHPLVNSTWTEEGLILHGDIHIGMATSLGAEGLIVPVIRHADRLSLLGIARAVNDLAERARTKRLQPEEVRDATFTLTNHGTAGSLFAMPIISQPQCGILGTGTIQKRPVVITDADGNDAIAIRPMVYLSFVFDHRILDGASADAFLAAVKETLEGWK